MADSGPVLLGALATDGIFLMTSEDGIIINSYKRSVSSDKIDFFDGSVGQTTGRVLYDFKAEYTIKGAINGTTGIMAAVLGDKLTFTNTSTGFGVDSGGIYVDKVELDHQPKQLREITVTMTQLSQID